MRILIFCILWLCLLLFNSKMMVISQRHTLPSIDQDIFDQMDIIPKVFFGTNEINERKGKLHIQPQPIRITFDYSQLDNPDNGRYLTFTSEMKEHLKKITNATSIYLQKLIKVVPRIKPIVFNFSDECAFVKVPERDRVIGIENSDLHIYVSYTNVSSNHIASAGNYIISINSISQQKYFFNLKLAPCYYEPSPLMGSIIFNVRHMDFNTENTQTFQNNVSITLHEVFHILSFLEFGMYNWIDPDTQTFYGFSTLEKIIKFEKRWNGKEALKISSRNIIRVAKNHFSCNRIDGMYFENQGSRGSRDNHWEKDMLQNELMTSSILPGEHPISEFTAALLIDTGFFSEINSNLLTPIFWGKNKGCEFFDNLCFSYKDFPEFPQSFQSCDYYSTGIGQSKQSNSFSQCNHVVADPKMLCNDSDSFPPNEIERQNTGEDSRCFRSNAGIKGQSFKFSGRCFKAKCADDLSQIRVNIWKDEYVTCFYPNQIINLDQETSHSTQGIMQCPHDFDLFCNYPKKCPNNCSSNGICNNGYCICLNGWVDDDCSKKCLDYEAWDGYQCVITCSIGLFKNFDNTCKTTCPLKQFGNKQTRNCELCPTNCSSCFGSKPNECISCNNGFLLVSGSCVDITCHFTCQSCFGPKFYQCKSCANGSYLDQDYSCQPCQFPCDECHDNNTECTSCAKGYHFNEEGKCKPSQECDSPCKSCSASDPKYCLSCLEKNVLVEFGKCESCVQGCSKCKLEPYFCWDCEKGREYRNICILRDDNRIQ